MKPFLGIDITENKKNEEFNGTEFLSAKTSSISAEAFEGAAANANDILKKAQLPLPVRIIHWICGFSAFALLFSIADSVIENDNLTLAAAYHNAPWMFWTAGICLVVWIILTIFSRNKAKEVLGSDENDRISSNMDNASKNIFAELDVPSSAKDVDILSFVYKNKNGTPKPVSKGPTKYFNFIFKVYADSEKIYLANLDGKYEIPFSSLRMISTYKKNVSVPSWNKDTPYNKGEYKQYKLYKDGYDVIHIKKYHILEFEYCGETWGIYFPNYELPVFESITGLKAR